MRRRLTVERSIVTLLTGSAVDLSVTAGTVFDLALRAATVSIDGIRIITLFSRIDCSVAASGDRQDLTGSRAVLIDLSVERAKITFLPRLLYSITAVGNTRSRVLILAGRLLEILRRI